MKIAKYLMAILSVCALSVACTKDYYIEGDDGVQMSHIDYTIRSNDWTVVELEGGASYVGVRLNVPQITKNVFNYGTVTVSRLLKDEDGTSVWTPLPVVSAEYVDYGTDDQQLYSTILDFEWGLGFVTVYYTATDFMLDEGGEPDMDLRVTIWQYD